MTDPEQTAAIQREFKEALRRMRRSVLLRLGAKLGYSISVSEADAALASPASLSSSFDLLERRHRFDWLKNPWLFFRQ